MLLIWIPSLVSFGCCVLCVFFVLFRLLVCLLSPTKCVSIYTYMYSVPCNKLAVKYYIS